MTHKTINYTKHIITNPKIMGGRPVIKGTRIPVETVLHRLAHELDTKTLLEDYPRLTEDDIKACLAYTQDILGEIYPAPEAHHHQSHL
jgi:uncharacterized protein (DUF433 family)